MNTLAGPDTKQKTGTIREYDAQGRHTTTARSLHAVPGGGWVIDTPGIRTLHVSDITDGIDSLFAEISELAPLCRFRDVLMRTNRDALSKAPSRAESLTQFGWNVGEACTPKIATGRRW